MGCNDVHVCVYVYEKARDGLSVYKPLEQNVARSHAQPRNKVFSDNNTLKAPQECNRLHFIMFYYVS